MNLMDELVMKMVLGGGTFYAELLAQMEKVPRKDIPTLGVEVGDRFVTLFYNPEYLKSLAPEYRIAALEHELLHVIMSHKGRQMCREHEKWNVAGDLAINQMLYKVDPNWLLPGRGMHANLPKGLMAEEYYSKLPKQTKGKSGSCARSEFDGKGNESKDGSGQEMNDVQKENIKDMVRKAKARGYTPGGLEDILDEMFRSGKISWRDLLRKQVAATIRSGSRDTWKRPSRRFGGV